MPRSTISYGQPKPCYSESGFFQKCRENAKKPQLYEVLGGRLLWAKGHPRSIEGRLEWA
jgi:hypothetical protein